MFPALDVRKIREHIDTLVSSESAKGKGNQQKKIRKSEYSVQTHLASPSRDIQLTLVDKSLHRYRNIEV